MGSRDIRAVLFDKDGTLLDDVKTWFPVYRDILLDIYDRDEEQALAAMKMCGYVPESHSFAPASPLGAGTPDEIASLLWPDLPADELRKRTQDMDDEFTRLALRHLTELMPLKPFFREMRELGLIIGIATNDNTQSAKQQMEALGVLDQFALVIGFDGVENPKPAGDMVHVYCEHTGLMPEHVAVVGDSAHDMLMGRAAGAGLVAGVLSGNSAMSDLSPHADIVIESIADLHDHVRPS